MYASGCWNIFQARRIRYLCVILCLQGALVSRRYAQAKEEEGEEEETG